MSKQMLAKAVTVLTFTGLVLTACAESKPLSDAGFTQSGSMSYPNRLPQGNLKTTAVP